MISRILVIWTCAVVNVNAVEIIVDGEALQFEWDDVWSCLQKHTSILKMLTSQSAAQKSIMGNGCTHAQCSALIVLTALAPSCERYAINALPEIQLSRYDNENQIILRKGKSVQHLSTSVDGYTMYADLGAALSYEIAHFEARRNLPEGYVRLAKTDWHVLPTNYFPTLFPETWVRKALHDAEKKLRFSFVGGLKTDRCTELARAWVLDFARSHFTSKNESLVIFTDCCPSRAAYIPLGDYDQTLNHELNWWNPKLNISVQTISQLMQSNQRSEWLNLLSTLDPWPTALPAFAKIAQSQYLRFDQNYFDILASSALVLTPAGDAPWSRRFFEAIMSCAIPIVQLPEHAGRTEDELTLGYLYYIFDPKFPTDHYKYRQDWANHNHRLFIRHNTLLYDADFYHDTNYTCPTSSW
uniref:Exostosin GT47 domain-containing protein n=1 Tax=Aureoumbra lagunensis TaxID=44058 RepID=A0A7S3JRA4_9STRA|mmetsp:Transcript_15716/g.23639  ORF Transcript_15716/g.23639 Transcript_15716/m.23639 type:complete len:412 (+) Transcript_15716:1328-2563(+)